MTALSVHALEKNFGERCLFSGLHFDIDEHDRVGLVGENGCGKTTLFRMLTEQETVDHGSISLSGKTQIGYLEQHACHDSNRTLWQEVESVYAPLIAEEARLEAVNERLKIEVSEQLLEEQHRLQEHFEREGGLFFRNKVRSTLIGLGFDETMFDQPVNTLSGGQRSKAAMGKLLLSGSNLLLLDEPTNHLDIAAVEWLENFLRGYTGAFLVISHDRYFLDKVTTRTLELSHGHLYVTNGNYSAHRAAREKEQEVLRHHFEVQSREIRRIEENIALLKQWNREKSIRAAESREKRVDRLKEQLEIPEEALKTIRFSFNSLYTSGNEVLNVENLSMGFGDKTLFSHVDFGIRRGERVFLLGPNGCGKTTLLRILMGQLRQKTGNVLFGAKVLTGYYDQVQEGLHAEKTAMDELWDTYPNMTHTQVRCAMASFLFTGDDVFKPVSLLSGGEKARLLLLKLMLAGNNFLLLDEPTNHLDIASREALEKALEDYDGTVLMVSHDRYFINKMADRVLALEPDGIRSFVGGYDAYLDAQNAAASPTTVKETVSPAANAYKQQKERDSLRRKLTTKIRRSEEEIAALEQRASEIEAALSTEEVCSDYARLCEMTEELQKVKRDIEERMDQWESDQQTLEELEEK